MKKLLLLSCFIVLTGCGETKFENVNIIQDKNRIKIDTKIYGSSFSSLENQEIIGAAIKDVGNKINSNEISITKDIEYVRFHVVWYPNKAAAAGDIKSGKWQTSVFVPVEKFKKAGSIDGALKYLGLVEGVMFGKDADANQSAKVFCENVENRKNSGAYCGFVASPIPRVKYSSKEGKFYLYEGGVSENDAKAGKKAGAIFAFEYLGEKNGEYKVRMENSSDFYTCTNPCESIKHIFNGNIIERIAYDNESVIGEVFQDATHDELEVAKLATKK